MSKKYDADNRYILEGRSFVDTKTNQCLNFGVKDLARVTVQLNIMERLLNQQDQEIQELKKQHLLTEKEWQDYCAYKTIEPQIKGCLDRERELEKKLAELEEQLKNAIVPKFKIGQEVWWVNEHSNKKHLGVLVGFEVSKVYDSQLDVYYRIEYTDGYLLMTDDFEEDCVFATKEEAEQRLKELQGE